MIRVASKTCGASVDEVVAVLEWKSKRTATGRRKPRTDLATLGGAATPYAADRRA